MRQTPPVAPAPNIGTKARSRAWLPAGYSACVSTSPEVAGGQSRRLSVSDASHCAARLGAVEARRRVEAGRYGMRAALGKDAARVARGQFRTSGFVFGCQPIAARIGPRDRRDQQLGVRVLRRRDDALDRARFRQMGAI